jgi:hypothetical protein
MQRYWADEAAKAGVESTVPKVAALGQRPSSRTLSPLI